MMEVRKDFNCVILLYDVLRHFHAILSEKEDPRFFTADLEELHRISIELSNPCHLCERRCGSLRFKGEKGVCGITYSRVSSDFLHFGEEEMLVPSHTVFFSGCNFLCVFCQNWDISQYPENGIYIEPEKLAKKIEKMWPISKNVNWVGGEPTPNLSYIISVLKNLKMPIPQVWNSNMYLTEEAMEVVNKITDLYLTDFKYGNDECAFNLSNVQNYWEIVTRNHLISEGDMIIRHLLLPGHMECCTKPILKWIKNNRPDALVNIMDQYRPEYMAGKYPGIDRRINPSEYLEAIKYAKNIGLNIYKES